ncbi:p-aminobenzoyl-glutamate transport protein [Planctomycetes bacterium Poly30]|uniref:p-aminobenzoyl-glutamate transport protein n=1 Tax=Saltatorellus ferox TaxID=2528018 RepID=A0A518EMM9_9BACT|nr:p-aminobenzoyl-glutamate transport protein [Planctomycetes bacterium Poly30]
MAQTSSPPEPALDRPRSGVLAAFLNFVERLGNLLPHPVTLFALFALGVVVVSAVAAHFGLEVDDIRSPERGGSPDGKIRVVSLLTADGLRRISTGLVTNFTSFAPLGTVLVALLGVGVAERSGLLSAGIRALVLAAPRRLLTPTIIFAAVLSNTASEMGYVVLVPLAAVIYHSVGRHPFLGLAAAFAGVSGGYSANLLIGTVDPLLAGITTEAAAIVDGAYASGGPKEVLATANWYFMAVSTFLITIVGTLVTEKVVAPWLGDYDESRAEDGALDASRGGLQELTAPEKKGLKLSAIALVVLAIGLALLTLPEGAPLRDPKFLSNPEAAANATFVEKIRPALKSVVALIFVFFIVPAVVFGRVTGTMRTDRDVIDGMSKAMASMGLYLVLVFFAAQFVAFFKWTNLGLILAVEGADLIRSFSLEGPVIFLPFILLCCFVNLMLGSASAQWAITAPIFVPMLMLSGYTPQVIQAAYRIGDSTTNIITPMMSYFGLILAFATRYDKKLGIGTIIATMLPYSAAFLVGWVALFYLWVFVLGFPVGPGTELYLAR